LTKAIFYDKNKSTIWYKVVRFEGGTATFPPEFMADPPINVAEK